ncbi:MAG: hypothetical protein LBL96_04070 [Clostridiales bacterium]|jgi:hypothetical protein|nr:hypothetical protein [Clostridiales bacterium]
MKLKGLLIVLLAIFLGVYADVNKVAVNDIALFIVQTAATYWKGSFFSQTYGLIESLPRWVIIGLSSLLRMSVCLAVLLLKSNSVKQGAAFVLCEPLLTIGNGLLSYIIFMALIVIFIVSVVGVPLAVMFLALNWFLTLVGEAAIGLAAGFILYETLGQKFNVFTYAITGVFIIEVAQRVPYVGYAVTIFMLPVACIGAIVTLIYKGYLQKYHISGLFEDEVLDMRKIVMRDV